MEATHALRTVNDTCVFASNGCWVTLLIIFTDYRFFQLEIIEVKFSNEITYVHRTYIHIVNRLIFF